ncbi:p-hydroxybenzoate 3-monooxygenase [Actinokineospora baliensis]|uniref:4-hydroxybenzoate 3-monooxygenase n=1 Tax=Actinokineospora baliensis TaxID=547056 RepID=UPI0027DADDF9|nr:4-hydroxybenzoate 3-monooxygenase [Actinokineospora baliensis]MBM7773144.1 p-hydroxybenzoate 3-monooxygenase [Actinokineospora baliensis]
MGARRTQVGIVGAGPAGLLLGRLLHLAGLDSVVVEHRSRDHVEKRVRAGLLEQGTVELLREAGVAQRLDRLAAVHTGFELRFAEESVRVPFTELSGRSVWMYGQAEVVKDLIAAREGVAELHFDARDVVVDDTDGDRPVIRYALDGDRVELRCDIVVGCDGYHGVTRSGMSALRTYEHTYPFAWLGVLVEAPPVAEELVYACHERGFALYSMRSPTVSRLYLQVDPTDTLDQWPDDRVWAELHTRLGTDLGYGLNEGPVIERGITSMRSFVAEPMSRGAVFLAGDAAHIVPPTAAKGLNLAVADVRVLAEGLVDWFTTGDRKALDGYSDRCLRRVWRAEEFSDWMTGLLHRFPDERNMQFRFREARLRYLAGSEAAMSSFSENYVGSAVG